mmetsp:Transcript_53364/g.167879  ORF Transcript_53364/g.167879 Transcript_53364/m.167879 type:complete len:401 (-) Transcript_53364:43-1245(-)
MSQHPDEVRRHQRPTQRSTRGRAAAAEVTPAARLPGTEGTQQPEGCRHGARAQRHGSLGRQIPVSAKPLLPAVFGAQSRRQPRKGRARVLREGGRRGLRRQVRHRPHWGRADVHEEARLQAPGALNRQLAHQCKALVPPGGQLLQRPDDCTWRELLSQLGRDASNEPVGEAEGGCEDDACPRRKATLEQVTLRQQHGGTPGLQGEPRGAWGGLVAAPLELRVQLLQGGGPQAVPVFVQLNASAVVHPVEERLDRQLPCTAAQVYEGVPALCGDAHKAIASKESRKALRPELPVGHLARLVRRGMPSPRRVDRRKDALKGSVAGADGAAWQGIRLVGVAASRLGICRAAKGCGKRTQSLLSQEPGGGAGLGTGRTVPGAGLAVDLPNCGAQKGLQGQKRQS